MKRRAQPTPEQLEREQLARDLGEQRMQRALVLIERAQNLLNEACAEGLSPILGARTVWNRVGDVADKAKLAWYAVEGARERLRGSGGPRVDAVHVDAELARRKESSAQPLPASAGGES